MIRRLFWLLVAFSLTGEIVSALALIAGPSEEVAAWAGWSFLGFSRTRWVALHYGLGLLLAVSGVGCLASGGKRMMALGQSERGTGPAWLIALMLFMVISLSSLVGLPPASTLYDLSTQLKAWHAKSFGEPPLSGAAAMTLAELSKHLGFDPDKALANLAAHNVKAGPPGSTLGQIAKDNGLVPAAVYETMRGGREPAAQVVAEAAKAQPPAPPLLPADPPPGLGRLKLSDVCEQYGINLNAAVDRLGKGGIKASGDMTLRQIAQSNLMLPIEVYDALRGVQAQASGIASSSGPAPGQALSPSTPAWPGTPGGPSAPGMPTGPGAPTAPGATGAPTGPVLPPSQTPGQLPGQIPGQPASQPGVTPAPGLSPGQAPGQPGQLPGQAPGQTPGQAPGQAPALSLSGAPAASNASSQSLPGAPVEPPAGLAKMTLAAFCREYGLDQTQALAKLKAKGMVVFSDMTFREVAIENSITPEQVMEFMVK